MITRFRLPLFTLVVALIVVAASGIAHPVAADSPPGFYHPTDGRAADALGFLFMHEKTSLEMNGDGEEWIEFLVTNYGITPVSAVEFVFRVNTTQYQGIKAWDEQGDLDYSVDVQDDEIHIRINFRDNLWLGETYRYFFVINFPGLADELNGEWVLNWRTGFPVAEFMRTVNLPGGATVTYTNPSPTEQTPEYVRWVRYAINEFTFNLRFTLQELNDLALAQTFAPYFRIHAEDIYVPMKVELALEPAVCYAHPGADPEDNCSLGLLGGGWAGLGNSYIDFKGNPGRLLNLPGSSHSDYDDDIRDQANAEPVMYTRVEEVLGGEKKVIQYWLYYYYNSWGYQGGWPGKFGLHEGDWEMVQLVLDADNTPLYAAYAQHDNFMDLGIPGLKGGSKKEWNDLEKVNGTHMVVYPALGSHASYFRSGFFLGILDKTAPIWKPFLEPLPAVRLLEDNPDSNWINYTGRWGQPEGMFFADGPKSPGWQGSKWDTPYNWSENELDWDEFARHHLGKLRAHIDAPCNVSLRDENSGQFFGWRFDEFISEIDGGEYIVNETLASHSLILHESYKDAAESFSLFATCRDDITPSSRQPAAPVNLTVEMYDTTADELVTAVFELPANWTPATTIATLEFTDGASPVLEVDRDNNGSVDEIVPPESVTSEPIGEAHSTHVFMPSIVRN